MPRLVLRPLERFLARESGSAALLLGAAVAALVWANVDEASYEGLWATGLALDLGPLELEDDLRHLVNDLLMAVFFYVIALEVKREILFGALRDARSASVPFAAAVGTMVGGAAAYLAVNLVADGEPRGWAIPIATDIAFALGVLGLAGDRVPRELRAFLLTLAVVDDLGTIAVIAIFYTDDLSYAWLGGAAAVLMTTIGLRRLGVRLMAPYVVLAGALWVAIFQSGVHGTVAGVLLGFLTPATALYSPRETGKALGQRLAELASRDGELEEGTLWEASRHAREGVSPLTRMETLLHPWSAYVILPLFAFANAGVPVSPDGIVDALTSPVGLGIAVGLVVGAPLGGILVSWVLVRLGPARLPEGLDWAAIGGVAPLKGIGFTVAIFISVLAFDDPALQEQAKLAILIASAVAASIGLAGLFARHLRTQR